MSLTIKLKSQENSNLRESGFHLITLIISKYPSEVVSFYDVIFEIGKKHLLENVNFVRESSAEMIVSLLSFEKVLPEKIKKLSF